MVNSCFVYGCGRNSKNSPNLSFYSLPKEKHRQIEWLKAAGRHDLLETKWSKSQRICSRHFTPSNVKNKSRHLGPEVVPTLHLPGQWEAEKSDDEHSDIICNSCEKLIVGFRYKCVSCDDFDLCQKCEALEAHPEHFFLRIPRPIKFKFADTLIKKWRKFFKAEHVTPDSLKGSTEPAQLTEDSSDDDQPITKYAKNYDSGIDLSEDIKEKIRKEIHRVTNLRLDHQKKAKKPAQNHKKKEEKKRRQTKEDIENERVTPHKRMKVEEGVQTSSTSKAPEVAFADVNDLKDNQVMAEIRPDNVDFTNLMSVISSSAGPSTLSASTGSLPSTSTLPLQVTPSMELSSATFPEIAAVPAVLGPNMQQPVMHVKLSDDLTELMIEVTSNNQRTIYKYPDASNQC